MLQVRHIRWTLRQEEAQRNQLRTRMGKSAWTVEEKPNVMRETRIGGEGESRYYKRYKVEKREGL